MCTSRMDGTLDEINETGEGDHLERALIRLQDNVRNAGDTTHTVLQTRPTIGGLFCCSARSEE